MGCITKSTRRFVVVESPRMIVFAACYFTLQCFATISKNILLNFAAESIQLELGET